MHQIQIAHNKISGTFRATCSCGWLSYDTDKAVLECRAANHDLDNDAPIARELESAA